MLLSICFKFQKNSIVLFAEVHFPCQREISISSSSKIHTCALHLLLALFGWKYYAIQLIFLLWVYCVVLNLTSFSQTCRVYHKIYISISFFYLQLLGFCGFICVDFFICQAVYIHAFWKLKKLLLLQLTPFWLLHYCYVVAGYFLSFFFIFIIYFTFICS